MVDGYYVKIYVPTQIGYSIIPKTYFDSTVDKFLGDQRSSYNHDLTFKLSIGENSPDPTIYDIILEGGAGLRVTQAIFGQGNPLPSDTVNHYVLL